MDKVHNLRFYYSTNYLPMVENLMKQHVLNLNFHSFYNRICKNQEEVFFLHHLQLDVL